MKTIQKFYSNPIIWIVAIVGVTVVAIMIVWQVSSIEFQAAGDSLKVNTVIPRAFQGFAKQKVQAAADKIKKDLETVLNDIVARHEKEIIIRPKL